MVKKDSSSNLVMRSDYVRMGYMCYLLHLLTAPKALRESPLLWRSEFNEQISK